MVDVFLDAKFIGTVQDINDFIAKVKDQRRQGKISKSLNIFYDDQFDQIHIDLSKGRARRPLIVVEDGKSRLNQEHIQKIESKELAWDDLVRDGIIEYIDAAEEENALVALDEESLTKNHTHLEISPVVILGLCTSLIPYSNFGGSSRLIRGSKIQKQTLGLYASNFLLRMDTDVSLLHYPQKPIVKTFMHDIYKDDNHPAGQNVVVAVMSYSGYNMQDAIILNGGSVQRGLARSTYFRPYECEELRYPGGLVDEIGIPDKDVKGYKTEKEYKHLEKDGIVYTGAIINDEGVIVGKSSPPRFLGDLEEFSIAASTRRESSTTVKHGEDGIVDMVVLTENEEGNRLVQVRLRQQRPPEIGDKFASRHGQKGVIGLIIPESDMPFTIRGMKPDIIFSPHGIPSRMTISHLVELVAGKVGALTGKRIDATTFDSANENDLRKTLTDMGFKEDGTEFMHNGITGEQFKVRIFIGDMYYLKLKYMVANKLQTRASGRVQLLTRQPTEGRGKGGGLRLGEMEKDCFVAHGASLLLKERFDSDKTIIYVCEKCGMFGIHDSFKDVKYCTKCGGNVDITPIELSYAFKLLLDELKAMCVYPQLKLKSKY